MKRMLALTLCLLMLVPVLVSCGKADDDKGAVIQMYMSSEIYDFDPAFAYTDDAASKVFGLIYEGLFKMNEKGKVEKALCKDYKIIEDKETNTYKMTVTINETAWSDGRAVSVDDLIYAWKRLLDPEFTSPAAAALFDIKNAKNYKNGDCSPDDMGLYAVDTKVLDIIFEGPTDYNRFIETLSAPSYVPLREDVISKATHWASNVAIMVANGPFAVRSLIPGQKLMLQRNSYYYRNVEKDKDDKYVRPYRIYIDLGMSPAEQLNAYNKGYLFYNAELPLEYRSDKAWKKKTDSVDLQSVHTYYFNSAKNPLFEKAEVRKALSMALDREQMASIVVFGTPAKGLITDGIFNTSRKNSFRKVGGDLISSSADVEGAKSMLSQAGVKKGEAFTITIRDNEVDKALAEYAKGVWEDLGFKVTIKTLSYKQTLENDYTCYEDEFTTAFQNGDFEVAGIDLQMFSTDAFSTLAGFAVGYSGTALDIASGDWDPKPGITNYNNSEYNELIDKAYNEKTNSSARADYLHQAEKKLIDDMAVIPTVVLDNTYISGKKLSGFSFDYFGCPIFTKAKLKKYKAYTNAGEN